jgi:hypothetical protein
MSESKNSRPGIKEPSSLDERLYRNSHEFGMASFPSEAEIAAGSKY